MQRIFRITWDGNNRQFQYFRKSRHAGFSWTYLSKIRKGVDDTGRNSSYGRWEMYFAATRCASLFKRQIRYNKTTRTTNTFPTSTRKNAFDVERYMSTRPAIVKPDEAFDIYEIDLSDEDAAAEE